MATSTLTPEQQATVTAVGAIGGWDESFGSIGDRAFGDYVTAANTAVDGFRTLFVEQRAAWQRQDATRDVADYTAGDLAPIMVALAQSAGRKLTLADGSQARARFDMLFTLCQHSHDSKAVDKFRGYVTATSAAGLTWEQYLAWLPTATRYTPSGKLTAAAVEEDRVAAVDAQAKADERAAARDTSKLRRAKVRLCGDTDFSHVGGEGLLTQMRYAADFQAYIAEQLAALGEAKAKEMRDQVAKEIAAAARKVTV